MTAVLRPFGLTLVLCAVASGCASRPVAPAPGATAPGASAAAATSATAAAVLKDLAGTAWTLRDLDGEFIDAAAAAGEPTWPALSLGFNADGLGAAGHGGLNRFAGRYTQDGSSLTFGPLAMTRRAGPARLMELERRYTQMLSRVVEWRQEGSRLILVTPGSKRAAVYDRAPASEVQ